MEKKTNADLNYYKVWGKRLSVIITVGFFVLMIICTLFGKKLYEWITPKVSVQMPKTVVYEDGERYIRVPKSAVTEEETIYVVTAESGFSRKIYRIREVEVEYIENEADPSEYLMTTRLPQGSMLVKESQEGKGLKDGEQVLIRR